MERLLISQLLKWKENPRRKPLVLEGARQVGKTWLLKEFGKRYFKDVCYVNFEQSEMLTDIFAGDLSPQRIIEQLSVYCGKFIAPKETLIIFDEVQEMPRALTSLKYFCEEAPEYAICCAGSLLGIALHEGTSFPVGKTDFLHLYPLSFKEFLMANNEKMLIDFIDRGNRSLGAFESRLIEYLKKYMIIGGMPAAVTEWLTSRDYNKVNLIQQELIAAYQNDFSKHAPRNMVEKIRYVWNSIPSQLAKENKKFVYGLVREGARAREYEDAIMWLCDAGEIIKTYNVSKPDIPISAYADLKSFKVFLLDVGLLRAMSKVSPRVILEGARIFEEFKGSLTEQYVCQELQSFSDSLETNYYWSSSATAEVDFLISDGLKVYPLEVKSGITMNAKSLKVYRDKYTPKWALRSSLLPYERNESSKTINLPLYMLFSLKEELLH